MADLEQTMRKLKESIRNLSAIQDSTSGGARQLEEEYFEQEGELGGDDASEFHQSFSSARSDTVDSMHSEDERGNGLISVGGSRSGSESLLNAIAREAILAGSLAPARQPEIEEEEEDTSAKEAQEAERESVMLLRQQLEAVAQLREDVNKKNVLIRNLQEALADADSRHSALSQLEAGNRQRITELVATVGQLKRRCEETEDAMAAEKERSSSRLEGQAAELRDLLHTNDRLSAEIDQSATHTKHVEGELLQLRRKCEALERAAQSKRSDEISLESQIAQAIGHLAGLVEGGKWGSFAMSEAWAGEELSPLWLEISKVFKVAEAAKKSERAALWSLNESRKELEEAVNRAEAGESRAKMLTEDLATAKSSLQQLNERVDGLSLEQNLLTSLDNSLNAAVSSLQQLAAHLSSPLSPPQEVGPVSDDIKASRAERWIRSARYMAAVSSQAQREMSANALALRNEGAMREVLQNTLESERQSHRLELQSKANEVADLLVQQEVRLANSLSECERRVEESLAKELRSRAADVEQAKRYKDLAEEAAAASEQQAILEGDKASSAVEALRLMARFMLPLYRMCCELREQKRFLSLRYRQFAPVQTALFQVAASVTGRNYWSLPTDEISSLTFDGRVTTFKLVPSLRAVVIAIMASNRLMLMVRERYHNTAGASQSDSSSHATLTAGKKGLLHRRFGEWPVLGDHLVNPSPDLPSVSEITSAKPERALELLLKCLSVPLKPRPSESAAASPTGLARVLGPGYVPSSGAGYELMQDLLNGRRAHISRLVNCGIMGSPGTVYTGHSMNRVKRARAARAEFEHSLWSGEGPGQPEIHQLGVITKGMGSLARELNDILMNNGMSREEEVIITSLRERIASLEANQMEADRSAHMAMEILEEERNAEAEHVTALQDRINALQQEVSDSRQALRAAQAERGQAIHTLEVMQQEVKRVTVESLQSVWDEPRRDLDCGLGLYRDEPFGMKGDTGTSGSNMGRSDLQQLRAGDREGGAAELPWANAIMPVLSHVQEQARQVARLKQDCLSLERQLSDRSSEVDQLRRLLEKERRQAEERSLQRQMLLHQQSLEQDALARTIADFVR